MIGELFTLARDAVYGLARAFEPGRDETPAALDVTDSRTEAVELLRDIRNIAQRIEGRATAMQRDTQIHLNQPGAAPIVQYHGGKPPGCICEGRAIGTAHQTHCQYFCAPAHPSN